MNEIQKLCVEVSILQGRDLVAKDRQFLMGKKSSSDPYVEVWKIDRGSRDNQETMIGRTETIYKTLSPVWNDRATFQVNFVGTKQCQDPAIILKIWDEDQCSLPDAMGVIRISLPKKLDEETCLWYDVPRDSAKNATGQLQVQLKILSIIFTRDLVRGNKMPLKNTNRIKVGLAWDMISGRQAVDLDVSCVAITHEGQVSKQDTVYYGHVCNSNRSIVHSGDEKEGDEEGDDENITLELDQISDQVLALYIVLTVASPNMYLSNIKSAIVRIYDILEEQCTLCRFQPAEHALSRNATAMFMVRISRDKPYSYQWVISPLEDTHPSARDYGSLIPQFKSYTRDLLPDIRVDPTERIAILRKNGNVRLINYCANKKLPKKVSLGLAWDVTNGVNIDLDASIVCLDSDMELFDEIAFYQLKSRDGSIVHHGDEREGDEIGDDETIDICLDQVDPAIQYIGLVINSYSGQELDDVNRASFHLFDPETEIDIATYGMTNAKNLDGFTALIVACLYRASSASGDWCLWVISEATMGSMCKDNVADLQRCLRSRPCIPDEDELEEPEISVDYYMPYEVPLADIK